MDKIKATFSSQKARDAAAQQEFGANLSQVEKALKAWEEAYAEGQKAVKNAPVQESTGDGKKKSSIEFIPINKESKNNAKLRGDAVLTTDKEILDAINFALTNRQSKGNYILGSIPDAVKQRIEANLGLSIFKKGEYVFKFSTDDIRHIEKHFSEPTEILQAVHRLYDVVCNYDTVNSEISSGGKLKLIFEKHYADYDYLSVEIASKGTRSLDLVTFYVTKNNKKTEGKIQFLAKQQDLATQEVSPSNQNVAQPTGKVKNSVAGAEDILSEAEARYLELAKDPEAWEKAYAEGQKAVKNAPVRQGTGEGKNKFSIGGVTAYDYAKPFSQQIQDWIDGKIPSNDSLVVSETPDVWKLIGMNSLPVTINQRHIDYAINGTKDADHFLTKEGLLKLPEAIKHPVAIISSKSKTGTSLVAMLEIRQNGKQVIVPVVIDGFSRQNNILIDSNALTSAYGKNYSISKVLHDALEAEANGKAFSVYYVNIKKATALLQKARVLMPKSFAVGANGFVHSIDEAGSPVKKKFSSQTETQQFKRWFGKSKVVNADGTPKVMYRGDSENFAVFDRKKSKYSNLYGKGFYFTDSNAHAGQYGNVRSFYLSVQNPVSTQKTTITKEQMRKFLEAVAENEDYGLENYGYGATIDSVLQSVYGKSDFAMLYDVSTTAIGDAVAAAELFNEVNGTNYDGFILDTETVVFEPTQIKSATDNIGTFDRGNPDIRYSVAGTQNILRESSERIRAEKEVKERLRYLGQQVAVTRQTTAEPKEIDRLAEKVIAQWGAELEGSDIAGQLQVAVDHALRSGGKDEAVDRAFQELVAVGRTIAENITQVEGDIFAEYRELRSELKGMRIYISPEVMADIPDYTDDTGTYQHCKRGFKTKREAQEYERTFLTNPEAAQKPQKRHRSDEQDTTEQTPTGAIVGLPEAPRATQSECT